MSGLRRCTSKTGDGISLRVRLKALQPLTGNRVAVAGHREECNVFEQFGSVIRNPQEVERAKRKHEREHPLTQEQKYAVLNAMYEEVKQLGRFKSSVSSDSLKHKFAMARILNAGV